MKHSKTYLNLYPLKLRSGSMSFVNITSCWGFELFNQFIAHILNIRVQHVVVGGQVI